MDSQQYTCRDPNNKIQIPILNPLDDETDYLRKEIKQYQNAIDYQNGIIHKFHSQLDTLQEQYNKLIDYLPLGYIILNHYGAILDINNPACALFKTNKNLLLDQPISRFIQNNDKNNYYIYLNKLTSTMSHQRCELEIQTATGENIFVQLDGIAKKSVDDLEFNIIISDITSRIHKEKKSRANELNLIKTNLTLSKYSRINAAGRLVSTIIHEINQPLMTIVCYIGGCIELLKKTSCSNEILTILNNSIHQAERVGHIIQRLKFFISHQATERSIFNINTLIKEVLELLHYEITKNSILIQLKLNPLLTDVYADKIQIFQVIMNLVQNAIQAMVDSSKPLRHLIIITDMIDDNHLFVSITDNGQGINEGYAKQIFDPFFTTKDKGIGLGLAISKLIIKAHGGNIKFLSDQHETTFTITLPHKV